MTGSSFAQNLKTASPQPRTVDKSLKKKKETKEETYTVHEYANGDVYEGMLQDGKFEGYGIYRWADGSVYQGYFHDGLQEREGTAFYQEKRNEYKGDWHLGMRHGKGVLHMANGDTYEGDWANDQRTGFGVYRSTTGDVYMGQWQKAADYATKVINNKKYSLAKGDDYAAMYKAAVGNSFGEIILEVYGSKKNEYWDNSGWQHLPYITSAEGSGDVCATSDLVDLYEDGDIRAGLFYKNENDNFTSKYSGKAGAVPYETNVPIIRLSEMYLNRAEAIVNGATISGVTAESDLKAIAEARGATAPSPSKVTILQERRKALLIFYTEIAESRSAAPLTFKIHLP